MEVVKNNPVLISGLIQAILGVLLAFGVDLSDEQVGAIMAVTAVVLAILARMLVTPINKLGEPPLPATSGEPPPEPPPVVDSM